MKKNVLFICTHNSARSQMAEGLMNYYFKDTWEAKSAGTIATSVKPLAIKALAELGIDIAHHSSKTIDTFKDDIFDVVVTVCDRAKETCPFFPGKKVIHKGFVDPSNVEGTDEEKLAAFCRTRDEIKAWLFREFSDIKVVVADTHFTPIVGYLKRLFSNISIDMVPVPELKTQIREAQVLIPTMTKIAEPLFASASNLRLVQQWGAGLDGVDIEAASRYGVPVANVPTTGTGNAESVAEWCVMMALNLSRQFPCIQEQVHTGGLWGAPAGQSLFNRTAGFVGFGGIGKALAMRLRPFGMRMVAVKRHPDDVLRDTFGLDWVNEMNALPRLLKIADYLFICMPLTPETRNLIDLRELLLLPKGAFLINAARGGIVNRDALIETLEDGHLGGVALDVFWQEPPDPEDPLFCYSNLLVTPHIAGISDGSYTSIAEKVAQNICLVMEGRLPNHCVNADALFKEKQSAV